MNRSLYTLLLTLAVPFILIRMWVRGSSNPGYRKRWGERFARIPVSVPANGVLIHSVSVGETLAAVPLVRQLQQDYPDLHITVTTTTPTGSDQVHRIYEEDLKSGRVTHVYLPYDLPVLMNAFLAKINPAMLIVMETELWPNLLRACHKKKIPAMVANARLSERSARGYARFSRLTGPMLNNISLIAAQHRDDAERFMSLGMPENRTEVTGSIKFDITVEDSELQQGEELRKQWGEGRSVLILASSHESEEALMLETFSELLKETPDLLLVIVPRHPERFDEAAALVLDAELKMVRRSESLQKGALQPHPSMQVYLADTMGEMMTMLATADIAVIGGSFIEHGGHNPLEASALGKAVVMGPSDFNFAAICQQLEHCGAIQRCDEKTLTTCLSQLMKRDDLRLDMGIQGRRVVQENQGAVHRLADLAGRLMHRQL